MKFTGLFLIFFYSKNLELIENGESIIKKSPLMAFMKANLLSIKHIILGN